MCVKVRLDHLLAALKSSSHGGMIVRCRTRLNKELIWSLRNRRRLSGEWSACNDIALPEYNTMIFRYMSTFVSSVMTMTLPSVSNPLRPARPAICWIDAESY